MEDQDRETRIDEDVEAHANKGSHKLANDEGDDVEGHMHKNSQRPRTSWPTTRATTSRATCTSSRRTRA